MVVKSISNWHVHCQLDRNEKKLNDLCYHWKYVNG